MWKQLDHESFSQEEIGYFNFFNHSVIGQMRAKEKLASKLAAYKHGLRDTMKPAGVLCFLGPSGVGKTYLVRIFANMLLKNPDAFVRIDCSTYQEEHSISRLIGSPPGYVGFNGEPELSQEKLNFWGMKILEEESKNKPEEQKHIELNEKDRMELLLIYSEIEKLKNKNALIIKEHEEITDMLNDENISPEEIVHCFDELRKLKYENEKINNNVKELNEKAIRIIKGEVKEKKETPEILPFSIILFDEIEKMHPKITRALLPMLDSGIVPLANGNRINFRNCFIFMTSNISSDRIAENLTGRHGNIGFCTKTEEEKKKNDSEQTIYDIAIEAVKTSPHFPTELIGRIGKENFIVFHPLEDQDMIKIINNQLYILLSRFQRVLPNLQIDFTDSLRNYILEETRDPMNRSLGARPVENVISAKIATALINLTIKAKNDGIVAGDRIRIEIETVVIEGKKKKKVVITKLFPDPILEIPEKTSEPKKEE